MKKTISSITVFLLLAFFCNNVFAQESGKSKSRSLFNSSGNVPNAGSFGVGVSLAPFNSSANAFASVEDKDKITAAILGLDIGYEMYFISQLPKLGLQMKYKLDKNVSFRMGFGFNGGILNYKEYLTDDMAKVDDPESEARVIDIVEAKVNSFNLNPSLEFGKESKQFYFYGGVGIFYSCAGSSINFTYGNQMTEDNKVPSTILINDSILNNWARAEPGGAIVYGRPLERYNVGLIHSIGLSLDLGLEWFFMPNVSLGANVTVLPLIFTFQPETYTIFEGYDDRSDVDAVVKHTMLVSPGSNALQYSTMNYGFRFSLHYYF